MLRIAKFYFLIQTFLQVGLLNHVNASLEECVERSTLQHTVLKQGEVDELVNNVVVLSIARDDFVTLSLLIADGLLCIVNIILLLLGNLFRLLLVLLLMEYGKASFLTLDFCKDWLQCFSSVGLSIFQYLLYQSMV